MAPLSAKVYKHHKKADGTYNVKIYVYHNSIKAYIDTEHYVTEKKLTTDLQIKDQHSLSILNRTLDDYRQAISDLGPRIKLFDGQSLKDFLIKKNEAIDFLAFCNIHINQLKANGQEKSASNYNTVRNHLRDFFENDKFPIAEISTGTLDAFVRFLKKARQLKRFNQFKKEIIVNGQTRVWCNCSQLSKRF